MRTVIVDDEVAHRVELKTLLAKYCPSIELVGEAVNVAEALVLIPTLKPDLLFLDIRMPNRNGFELLSSLQNLDLMVIFTTGYDQYAIQAIRSNALDYLLKPIDPNELLEAVIKASNTLAKGTQAMQLQNLVTMMEHQFKEGQRIFLPLLHEARFIQPKQLLYCEARNNCTAFILMDEKELVVARGMVEYEPILLYHNFLRCHQSYLVNVQYITAMVRQHNIHEFVLQNKMRVPVSRLKKDLMMDALKKLNKK